MLQNLSSAAVVIGALRVNSLHAGKFFMISVICFFFFLKKQQNLRLWSAKFVVCCSRDWRFKG